MAKFSMITTIQQHVLHQQEELFPEARGVFSALISGISLATKAIQAQVRRAGLGDQLGAVGETNVQGEEQQKLDVYANQSPAALPGRARKAAVSVLVSEENEEPVTFDRALNTGRYIVVFDPLDGSSNIDVNVPVGTIFSISSGARRRDRSDALRAAARFETCGGGLRRLRFVDDFRLHGGTRRFRVHAGSQCRRVRAGE